MPVTAENFINTFTDSPNSHNKQDLAFLPLSHEDIEAQKLTILAKATWQWVGPKHSSRSLWLQGPCSPHHLALLQQCEITDVAQIKIAWSCDWCELCKVGGRDVGARQKCVLSGETRTNHQRMGLRRKKKSVALKMLKHFVSVESSFPCNDKHSETQWNMGSEAIENAAQSYSVLEVSGRSPSVESGI